MYIDNCSCNSEVNRAGSLTLWFALSHDKAGVTLQTPVIWLHSSVCGSQPKDLWFMNVIQFKRRFFFGHLLGTSFSGGLIYMWCCSEYPGQQGSVVCVGAVCLLVKQKQKTLTGRCGTISWKHSLLVLLFQEPSDDLHLQSDHHPPPPNFPHTTTIPITVNFFPFSENVETQQWSKCWGRGGWESFAQRAETGLIKGMQTDSTEPSWYWLVRGGPGGPPHTLHELNVTYTERSHGKENSYSWRGMHRTSQSLFALATSS